MFRPFGEATRKQQEGRLNWMLFRVWDVPVEERKEALQEAFTRAARRMQERRSQGKQEVAKCR